MARESSNNIVRIGEIGECVNRAIQGIRDGVAEAIKSGIQAELPEKVDFTMTVVKDWQLLDIQSSERGTTAEKGITAETSAATEKGTVTDKGTSTEKQTGTTSESQISSGTDNQAGTEKRDTQSQNTHTQNTDSVTETEE
jgi:hypothetical protein